VTYILLHASRRAARSDRAKGRLLAAVGAFNLEYAVTPKQDEFHFHNWFARIE